MKAESKKTDRTKVKSFRLDSSTIELLEKEARTRNVSSNAIVRELLEVDLRKDYGLKGIRTVTFNSSAARLLTEGLSPDEKIIEIAEKVSKDPLLRLIPLQLAGSMSVKAILQSIRLLNGTSESEQEGKRIVIIPLESGRNLSLFFGALSKALFASIGVNINYTINDDAAILEFDEETTQMLSEGSRNS